LTTDGGGGVLVTPVDGELALVTELAEPGAGDDFGWAAGFGRAFKPGVGTTLSSAGTAARGA
jgi:hypothetical protein